MIVFWVIAALISVAACGVILHGARAAPSGPLETVNPALALHRRALAEVDALAARGALAEDEHLALRSEAARRLLAAAQEVPAPAFDRPRDRYAVLVVAALAPALALAVYSFVGAPGYGDQPMTERITAWRADDPRSLDAAQMAAVLKTIVLERPADAEPLRALGIAQMAAGEPVAAQTALRKAINLAPSRADLWSTLGEAFAAAADGEVGADSQSAFREALKRDPSNLAARYYLGRAVMAAGDKAAAVASWTAVLAELPIGDPRRVALEQEIAFAEGRAAPSGPTAAQVAAAQGQVGPEQIRAMIDGLAQRLATRPDDPDGWVRLVRAYGVIGETAKRDATLATARAQYAKRPEVLQALAAAATGAAR